MKTLKLGTLAFAVVLYTSVAFAQHGHAAGAVGMGNTGNGNAMGHDTATSHGNSDAANPGNASSGKLASAHAQTVNDILTKNTHLADKISKLTGESATAACSGFKNLGQCVAAAHVAKNLGLNFDCLKSDMTGTAPPQAASCPADTGSKSVSLGKAIQTLDPNADQKTESKKGQTEAAADLKSSNS